MKDKIILGGHEFVFVAKLDIRLRDNDRCSFSIDKQWSEQHGVYAYFDDDGLADEQPFYIGSTNNLQRRIRREGNKNAPLNQSTNVMINEHVAKLVNNGKEVYLYFFKYRDIEHDLIQKYKIDKRLINRL